VIEGRVHMGRAQSHPPGACIGLEPQDFQDSGAPPSWCSATDNTIRECASRSNRRHADASRTVLGSGNLLMAFALWATTVSWPHGIVEWPNSVAHRRATW